MAGSAPKMKDGVLMEFDENLKDEETYNDVEKDFQDASSEELKKIRLSRRASGWSIFKIVRERSLKENLSAFEYRQRLGDVEEFLNEVHSTFRGQIFTNNHEIWQHQEFDLNMTLKTQKSIIEKDGFSSGLVGYYMLVQLVEFYLARPWMQINTLDWVFLDCLIFLEIESFLETVKTGQIVGRIFWTYHMARGNLVEMAWWELGWRVGIWILRYPLPLGILGSLKYLDYEQAFIGMAVVYSVYIISRLLLWPSRFFKQKDLQKKLKEAENKGRHMTSIYWYCSPPVLSPRVLKEALEKGREAGVYFGGATYVLLDRILAKNPSQFLPFCQPITEL